MIEFIESRNASYMYLFYKKRQFIGNCHKNLIDLRKYTENS